MALAVLSSTDVVSPGEEVMQDTPSWKRFWSRWKLDSR
jgi:hypothetical protein